MFSFKEKGKKDPGQAALEKIARKMVHQFAPVLLPFSYLLDADLENGAKQISSILHAYALEYPEQMRVGHNDDRARTIKLHLLKLLFQTQKSQTKPVTLPFAPNSSFLFSLELIDRWVLVLNWVGEWNADDVALVLDIEVQEEIAHFWHVISKAKHHYLKKDNTPDCRHWPLVLWQYFADREHTNFHPHAMAHLENCSECTKEQLDLAKLDDFLCKQIPNPAWISSMHERTVHSLCRQLKNDSPPWHKKLYRWALSKGIIQEKIN